MDVGVFITPVHASSVLSTVQNRRPGGLKGFVFEHVAEWSKTWPLYGLRFASFRDSRGFLHRGHTQDHGSQGIEPEDPGASL